MNQDDLDALEATGLHPIVIDEHTSFPLPRRTSNAEFIVDLMDFCPTGALSHAMVMQAVEQFAKRVLTGKAEDYDNTFISGEAWIETAAWIAAQFDVRRIAW